MLVLDEADRMLMGFSCIRRVLTYLPKVVKLVVLGYFEDQIKNSRSISEKSKPGQVSAQNAVASSVSHRAHPVIPVVTRLLRNAANVTEQFWSSVKPSMVATVLPNIWKSRYSSVAIHAQIAAHV